MVMYNNSVPAPFLPKYYICIRFLIAAEIYNGVLDITTWYTYVIGAPCTLFNCPEICLPPFSISQPHLPHFLATVSSLKHSVLSFPGRSYRSLRRWLEMWLTSGKITLLPISICNLILYLKIIRSLFNEAYSPRFVPPHSYTSTGNISFGGFFP